MSFAIRQTMLAARPRVAFAPRAFSTSLAARKSVVDNVKETLSNVNKKVGETLAGGIESTESAAQKAASAAGMTSDEAKGKAEEMAGASKGKADEMIGATKGKANELSGAAQGKINEVKGKM